MELIDKAIQFAARKHEGQYRKGTDNPYVSHPFGVALILQQEGYGDEVLAAGLLHDTLEDTETSVEELVEAFGERVTRLVLGATEEDRSLAWEERKQRTVSGLREKTPEQLAVIVADKLHNLRSIVNDCKVDGEAVWSRFKRGKREQSWYYMSIVQALISVQTPLINKLEFEAKRFFIGTSDLSAEKIAAMLKAGRCLSEQDRSELERMGILRFVEEVRASRRHDVLEKADALRILLNESGFESVGDVDDDLYAYWHELQFRLGWSDEKLLFQFKMHGFN